MQIDAAQDEGEDRRGEVGPTGQATGGDRAPVAGLAEDGGQGLAPDDVDRTGPALAVEGPTRGGGQLVAVDEGGGAQGGEQSVGLGSTGRGRHRVAEVGQEGDGDRPDAPSGAGHQDLGVVVAVAPGTQPVVFEGPDTEHGGETGGADGHRLEQGETVGFGHQPLRPDPLALGVAARVGLRQSPSGDDHLVARLPVGGVGRLDGPGQIDPADQGEGPDDAAGARDGQTVLVVEARVTHGHGDVPVGEVGVGQLRQCAARCAVDLGGDDGGVGHWALTTFQVPPKLTRLFPLATPGAESPA